MIARCNAKGQRTKNGKYFCLYSSDGSKLLGRHKTEAAAKKQERAVSISKARKAGHKIPNKRK